jgi:ribosomal protein L1
MADISGEKQRKKRKLNFTVTEIDTLTSKVHENLDVLAVEINKYNNKSKKEQNLGRHN